MNILFLTLVEINSVEDRGIYHDLLRKFRNEGHDVTIVSPVERRKGISTNFSKKEGVSILQVKTFNIQKTNIIEKGIGTLAIEYQYLSAIKKHLTNTKFDLVLYSTPPITFAKVIEFIKKRDHAKSYLLLKDIFPQNAVDMSMLKKGGFVHKQFLKKEKKLYQISDTIGCMSRANVDFVLRHNPEIEKTKVEVNPNSIEIVNFKEFSAEEKFLIKNKYGIPANKKVFIYGGNLGKPQGVDFLIETLNAKKNDDRMFFIIAGSGTEYDKIKNWIDTNSPNNILFLSALPKKEYDLLVQTCDIGLIFLHRDFTIPNYPSRLLSYLEFKMPVLAATDPNTDIGLDLLENKCGLTVISDDLQNMITALDQFVEMDTKVFEEMRQNSFKFLQNNFQVKDSYSKIIKAMQIN
ncbi:glycosyltransferase family 4 protein [Chryseobacterium chendengshani]|uniref:glycosyltransferase family 4 protein n=1 Tax=Chryseobacterium sp. LJ668 TaxID=2864040 RepID=UPI001C6900BF|nr:glycosyltransferase family 4 protein [Chryseobacterium sp. LJ668]MBW8523168.1 glycosyltransferase family 4 protein [Chryseobacterium sp. LJ668]QYK15465.1 glycosyltransferase family 4 protein [Chryseobacterium sp. LJ668]